MPFVKAWDREKQDLDYFFEDTLKKNIENHEGFLYKYTVSRSNDSFNIGKQIIRDISAADIVLCDLSGEYANPNVMYELGVRLALTNKPVIIFREENQNNKNIFDVSAYHCKPYSVKRYGELVEYIIEKIKKFETEKEEFESPVLEALKREPSVVEEIAKIKVFSQLIAIAECLQGLCLHASAAVYTHLMKPEYAKKGNSFAPPTDTEQLINFLYQNAENLDFVKWDQFNFTPNLPPALHDFLAVLPLEVFEQPWLSKIWNTALLEYYNRYFSTSLFWDTKGIGVILDFLTSTHLIHEAIRGLIGYVSEATPESERQNAKEHMLEMLNNIFNWKERNIVKRIMGGE